MTPERYSSVNADDPEPSAEERFTRLEVLVSRSEVFFGVLVLRKPSTVTKVVSNGGF
jgi:hypothetical protein